MTLIGIFVQGFQFLGGGGIFPLPPPQDSFSPLKSHTNVWIYNVA